MIRKKKGFVLLPVVLATFIMGMLGIGLASMYSGTFSTMNAGKAASKAKDFATIEGNYVKLNGYDTASSMTHDWESLSDLVGPDATGWQSKVETSSTATSADGNQVKVMKVAVKKDSDIASRYTYEVPVVQGKDSYTKAEIDAMMAVINGNFTSVNSRLDQLANTSNNLQSQINALNTDVSNLSTNLGKLSTLVENYRTSLLNSINNVQGNLDKESSARIAADTALNSRCDAINKSINSLQDSLNNTKDRVTSLEKRTSDLEAADASIRKDMNSIKDDLTGKYSNLQSKVGDLTGKVNNIGSKVDTNTTRIASINDLLNGNTFIRNDSANKDKKLSLAYNESDKKLHAYYGGAEVPLGSQDGAGGIKLYHYHTDNNAWWSDGTDDLGELKSITVCETHYWDDSSFDRYWVVFNGTKGEAIAH